MGEVTPANWRRFVAKNGSGRVLSFTKAATTVVGTVASCHPLETKAAVEIISPLASTLADDCSVQCSRSASLSVCAGAALDAGVSAARRKCAPRNDISNNGAANRAGKSGRVSFAFAEFMLLPWGAVVGTGMVDHFRGPWSGNLRGITRLLIRFNR